MDTFAAGLLILRLGVGLTFAVHGAQKLFGVWGGPGMRGWTGAMEQMGFRPAALFAAVSALVEFVGGAFLAIGLGTPLVAALLIAQSVVIIGQVHWRNGFFNAKGGYEFPLILAAASGAIGLATAGAWSVDSAIGLAVDPTWAMVLLGFGLVAGIATLAYPRLAAAVASPRSAPQS